MRVKRKASETIKNDLQLALACVCMAPCMRVCAAFLN